MIPIVEVDAEKVVTPKLSIASAEVSAKVNPPEAPKTVESMPPMEVPSLVKTRSELEFLRRRLQETETRAKDSAMQSRRTSGELQIAKTKLKAAAAREEFIFEELHGLSSQLQSRFLLSSLCARPVPLSETLCESSQFPASPHKTKAFVFFHNQPDGGGQTLDESRRFPSWRLAPLAGKLSPSAREFHPPLSEVLWNYRISFLSYPWRHPAPRSIHQDGLSDLFPAAGLLCNNPIQPSRPSTKVHNRPPPPHLPSQISDFVFLYAADLYFM
ncbi:hypothetical protein BRADI_1g40290v3 [Brachypodium distachyon]|uniref:Uncharacterized protein n=1 Tax=Brachypodium distachyon TaxID=15368 RepID=A0A0Q3JKW1_BRADI|nr:hypothetical protein BRADI_1g40290v3 [Brachypodium distachyon]KQK18268.1 hypothetical protein BRADI_1g40290v3 [Brachypodium distachyon]